MRRRLALLSMVVLLALVGGSGYYALPRASGEHTPFIPGGISLVRPAVAQQNGASFLDTDAGMSAYSDTGRTINIDQARTAFRVVERATDSWIVGTVQAHDYDEMKTPMYSSIPRAGSSPIMTRIARWAGPFILSPQVL